MSVSMRRVRAIFRKELQEYRRNGALVVATMAVIPLIFVIPPMINVLSLPGSASTELEHGDLLLYLLGIPAIVPAVVAVVAAYSVVGERQQGTLEPAHDTDSP